MGESKEKSIADKVERPSGASPEQLPENWFAEKGFSNPKAIYEPDIARQMLGEVEEVARRRTEEAKDPAFQSEAFFQETLREIAEFISYAHLISSEANQRVTAGEWTRSEIPKKAIERSIHKLQEYRDDIKTARTESAWAEFEAGEKGQG